MKKPEARALKSVDHGKTHGGMPYALSLWTADGDPALIIESGQTERLATLLDEACARVGAAGLGGMFVSWLEGIANPPIEPLSVLEEERLERMERRKRLETLDEEYFRGRERETGDTPAPPAGEGNGA